MFAFESCKNWHDGSPEGIEPARCQIVFHFDLCKNWHDGSPEGIEPAPPHLSVHWRKASARQLLHVSPLTYALKGAPPGGCALVVVHCQASVSLLTAPSAVSLLTLAGSALRHCQPLPVHCQAPYTRWQRCQPRTALSAALVHCQRPYSVTLAVSTRLTALPAPADSVTPPDSAVSLLGHCQHP